MAVLLVATPTPRHLAVGAHGVTFSLEILDEVAADGSRPSPQPTLAHLHRDERTALAAARQVALERGHRLVSIEGEHQRRITFALGGQRYSFDPNRIFTPAGRKRTLEGRQPIPREALEVVEAFSAAFLDALGPGPILAAHNNSPGPPLFIQSYLAGGAEARSAQATFIAPGADGDDFALVTTQALFDGLKGAGFNVVWQAPQPPDDGSLSVYCGQHGIAYANVEALESHHDQQVKLIRAAADLLARAAK